MMVDLLGCSLTSGGARDQVGFSARLHELACRPTPPGGSGSSSRNSKRHIAFNNCAAMKRSRRLGCSAGSLLKLGRGVRLIVRLR